jgi:hypothetical protein
MQRLSNYAITMTATVDGTNTVTLSSSSTITINITDKSNPFHWMAYELGFRSNFTISDMQTSAEARQTGNLESARRMCLFPLNSES